MNPRVPSSKKWTSIPNELCSQIREVFEENFADQSKNGQIIVEGRIYPNELLLRVGYLEKGRLKQANFEVSQDFDPNQQNALQLIHLAVDCAASMMGEFFDQAQELESFPQEWQSFAVEKKMVFVRVSTVNSQLEAAADRLLSENSDDLVQGEDEEQDRQAVITMLGLGGPDDNDLENTEGDNDDNKENNDDGDAGGDSSDGGRDGRRKPTEH